MFYLSAKTACDVTLDNLISSFPVETRKLSQSKSESSERSQKLSETSNGSEEQDTGSTNGEEVIMKYFSRIKIFLNINNVHVALYYFMN